MSEKHLEFLGYEEGASVYMRFLDLPSATPFHTLSWLRFVQGVLPGSRVRFLTWHKWGYPSGVLPLVERKFLFLRAGYSVPFDAPGGPLGSPPPENWHTVFSGYWHARICDPDGILNPPWKNLTVPVHSIDPRRFAPSRSQMKAARQAERRGLVLEEIAGFSDELYRLYIKVKTLKSGLILGAEAMSSLFRKMKGHIFGFIARHGDRATAFILNLRHNQRASAYLHGFDREFAEMRPMSALVMRSVEFARDMGLAEFSLGSTALGDRGQASFKESFGAVPRPMRIHIKQRLLGLFPRRKSRII